jgi:hypothetical protein
MGNKRRVLLCILALLLTLSACNYPVAEEPGAAPATSETGVPPAVTQAPVAEPAATLPATPVQTPAAAETPPEQPAATQEPVESGAPGPGLAGIHLIDLKSAEEVSLFTGSGAAWVRFDNFHWDAIEPERTDPPTYHWEAVDEAALLSASENGMEVIGIILFTPPWAQRVPGVACGPVAEEALGRFADFTAALVERYSQPPYNVKVWEIGNEPDIPWVAVEPHSGYGCWADVSDQYYGGSVYAEALKAVYPAIKAADPEAQVLVGGLVLDCDPRNPPENKDCSPALFLEGILRAGGGDYFDGVSFHAYDYYAGQFGLYGNGNWNSSWNTNGPVLVPKAEYIRSLLEAHGAGDKALLNTEVALLCVPEDHPVCGVQDFTRTKAGYAAQANAIALMEGLEANIWYHIRGWRGSGLVDALLRPNLAYEAFSASARMLQGAVFNQELMLSPGVRTLIFDRGGVALWVIWSQDGQPHQVGLPADPTAVYDMLGATLPVQSLLNVEWTPVYVEF